MNNAAGIVASHITGDWSKGDYTGGRPAYDEIARLAHRLYESRGRQDGHHIEDGLRAEQELVRHYSETAKYQRKPTTH